MVSFLANVLMRVVRVDVQALECGSIAVGTPAFLVFLGMGPSACVASLNSISGSLSASPELDVETPPH